MEKTKNIGSSKILTGYTYPLAIFVSTANNLWDREGKLSTYNKIRVAQKWLSNQAGRYNASLSFHNGGCYGLDNDIIVDYIPQASGRSNEYVDWVRFLLYKIGWKNPIDLYNRMIKETSCQNLHILMFANSRGTSYSIPHGSLCDEAKYFVEGCFLYRRYKSGYEICPASIAHEILHIYGAWDLYQTFEVSKEQADKAGELFPNDIMHKTAWDIDELNISPFTAWRIGWTDKQEDWYEWFRPKNIYC